MGYFEKIYRSDLSHRARAVYMYLKDRADSNGSCWPGINTIAVELGLSRSTVNPGSGVTEDVPRISIGSYEEKADAPAKGSVHLFLEPGTGSGWPHKKDPL